MLDHEPPGSGSGTEPQNESATDPTAAPAPRQRRRAASRPSGSPAIAAAAEAAAALEHAAAAASPDDPPTAGDPAAPEEKPKRARTTRKTTVARRAKAGDGNGANTAETPADDAQSSGDGGAAAGHAPDGAADRVEVGTGDVGAARHESARHESVQPEAEEAAPKARRTRKRATSPAKAPAPAPEPALIEAGSIEARSIEARSIEARSVEAGSIETEPEEDEEAETDEAAETARPAGLAPVFAAPTLRPGAALIFQAPIVPEQPVRRPRQATAKAGTVQPAEPAAVPAAHQAASHQAAAHSAPPEAPFAEQDSFEEDEPQGGARESRRRRRRSRDGRPANQSGGGRADRDEPAAEADDEDESALIASGSAVDDDSDADAGDGEGSSRRRRRRRRRQTAEDLAGSAAEGDDPPNTVVKIREPRERRGGRNSEPDMMRTGDEVQGVRGSVRLAAKQQRRRDGRSTRSRRVPIVTEAEFLARRESVERVMVVRQAANRTQIGVLEDGVLVEHYVNRESSVSYVGNVYLGKVQNVLSSMEAAFVDINKGRNAVLYAGEVNFAAAGLEGQPKRIESALKSGQPVLVQVTKDPFQHKGARLTSQISLPGRYLVYIPGGSMMGISRKLPDNERLRLKQILKKVVPEDGGVIVRTAAEGASEEELARDVERLVAQWEEIERRARTANAPALLHGEPDLTVRVIRDIFNEDFTRLIVSGDEAYKEIHEYLSGVAPELAGRVEHWTSETDAFSAYRVDEQLAKALDRKVWLPSGGSLVIDRTEAMVVIDVNTGKFTGQGSNSLEETVTRNNLEAAEEIVRQLRLRDLGGIIVIDFIDMVLESNRDLVLRRLLECLGRDRTKHQVAEVTSLGLVQMTRKRVGQGLLEAFSETCDHCNGRGVIVHLDPVEPSGRKNAEREQNRERERDRAAGNGGNGGNGNGGGNGNNGNSRAQHVHAAHDDAADVEADSGPAFGDEDHAHGNGAAAETRANRRRRRKGRHLDGDESYNGAENGGSADSDEDGAAGFSDAASESAPRAVEEPREPINLRAHAEDPDAAIEVDTLSAALADTGRPRKRRRAASRPAGPAGSAAAAS